MVASKELKEYWNTADPKRKKELYLILRCRMFDKWWRVYIDDFKKHLEECQQYTSSFENDPLEIIEFLETYIAPKLPGKGDGSE